VPRLLKRVAVVATALLITIVTISAADASPFDEPSSECGESTVVFAMEADADSRSAYLELPAGVYIARLIAAVTNVDLGSVGRTKKTPYVSVASWFRHGEYKLRSEESPPSGTTVFSNRIATPGGIIRVSVGINFGGADDWDASSRWRWEIIRPGICAAPVQPEDE